MNRNGKHREKLMRIDPHCQRCGVELVYFKPRPHEPLPDNFATLEHVNSRTQSRPRPMIGKTVLWCRRCNQERGAAEQAALGIELPQGTSRAVTGYLWRGKPDLEALNAAIMAARGSTRPPLHPPFDPRLHPPGTFCRNGHRKTPENTQRRKDGTRRCRAALRAARNSAAA